jgi:prepilin-type N-terminal cleavage/methylation domain-containing protein
MRRGFTLLEVMVAIAILVAAMLVLVSSQATAVLMTTETERILTANMLAREKMTEVQTRMEKEGFGQADLEEEGDFADFGSSEGTGADLQLEIGNAYDDYRYAWTVRMVDITMAGDLTTMADSLVGSGLFGEQTPSGTSSTSSSSSSSSSSETKDPNDTLNGFSGMMDSMASQYLEMLGNYIREVRVVVWWGDDSDGTDQVELVSHIINPTGMVSAAEEQAQ